MLSFIHAFSQERNLSGKVYDENNEPMPGASVIIKGTTQGTVTNIDGEFRIVLSSDQTTIVVSYIGYKSKEIEVGTQSQIDVRLELDQETLDEVIVVGYGTQEKSDLTGVVTSVDSKNFNAGAITSPDNLIAGKVAGVQITPSSGEPGGQVSVRIRGGTSITASNEPLFVIDGVPIDNSAHNPGGFSRGRNPLNFLNPDDIENITVLKDASAAAIYGARGANGVIIINTKKGDGSGKITYNGYVSMANLATDHDMLSADAFRNVVTAKQPNKLNLLGNNNTDWYDQILQTGIGHNHYLSFSGGGKNSNFRFSLGHQDIEGIVQKSRTQRTSLSTNFSKSFFDDRLNINANIKAAYTKDKFDANPIGAALAFDPTQKIFDSENNALGGYFEYPISILAPDNPVSLNDQTQDVGDNIRNIGNIQLEYKLPYIEGLSAKANLGYDMTFGERKRFKPNTLRNQATSDSGEVKIENYKRINPLFNFYFNYKRDLPSINSNLDVTAGYEYQDFKSDYPSYRAYGLSTNAFGFYSAFSARNSEAFNTNEENRLISFFGRVNYSLHDKYLLTFTLRRDGSSRFGENNRWGLFPSVAIGWRLIEEDFMSFLQPTFSDLKLRFAYGVTGSQEIGNYLYLSTYEAGQSTAAIQQGNQFINTLRPNGYDANIKWEETNSLNIGLDFALLDGKLGGSLEYYQKNTKDLLFEVGVASGSNLSNRVVTNIGEMQNSGVELALDAFVIDQKDLSWNLGFNASYNKNEIKALDQSNEPDFEGYLAGGIAGGTGNNVQILRVGESVNTFYVYEHIVDPATGNPVSDNVDFNGDGIIDQADMYRDTNGDGGVNSEDRRPYKNANPDVILGLTSSLTYKDFDLNLTLRSNIGNYVYNNIASDNGYYNKLANGEGYINNIHESVLESGYQSAQFFSDYYVENASFLRMDNITLGYRVRQLSNIDLRVYATMQNLFVLTNYTGMDPEVGYTNRNSDAIGGLGIDDKPYPKARTILFGVNLSF